jgi:hypothetical protein
MPAEMARCGEMTVKCDGQSVTERADIMTVKHRQSIGDGADALAERSSPLTLGAHLALSA